MVIKTLIRWLVTIYIVTTAITTLAEEYLYTSPFGYEVKVVLSGGEYTVKAGDVTEVITACNLENNKVCLISNNLDVIIPKGILSVGQSWAEGGTTFRVTRIVESLNLLNNFYKEVYLIAVDKDLSYYLGVKKIKKFELLYAIGSGLIAFRPVSDKHQFPFQYISGSVGLGS